MVKYHLHQAFFTTRGGEWANIVVCLPTGWKLIAPSLTEAASSFLQLPFNRFMLTYQGQVEGEGEPINASKFQSVRTLRLSLLPSSLNIHSFLLKVSFLMAERQEGPFRLELEWIKAINTHTQEQKRYTGLTHDDDDG